MPCRSSRGRKPENPSVAVTGTAGRGQRTATGRQRSCKPIEGGEGHARTTATDDDTRTPHPPPSTTRCRSDGRARRTTEVAAIGIGSARSLLLCRRYGVKPSPSRESVLRSLRRAEQVGHRTAAAAAPWRRRIASRSRAGGTAAQDRRARAHARHPVVPRTRRFAPVGPRAFRPSPTRRMSLRRPDERVPATGPRAATYLPEARLGACVSDDRDGSKTTATRRTVTRCNNNGRGLMSQPALRDRSTFQFST